MSNHDDVNRTQLPIPDIQHPGLITFDAKDPDTKFPPIRDLRPPKGAPNVLVILIDDVGYGATSAFGGPCQTPNFEKLAKGGLRYTRFHTTALCSPTRQALLTGRNHHSVGMGGITEIATAAPGQCSVLPNTKAPLALTLKLNGYATAQFGKCHEVPVWQTSPAGPFNAWPTGGGGFEYFYGFIGGENNQWDPALYEGTTPIEPPKTPAEGYHLTEDLADKFIAWTRQQKALLPDKPFFVYFAPGATHAPHHVPKEWIEKYKGKFAHGWDKQREITFKRQKELGVIAANAELTPRHKEIPAWDDMDPKLKPVLEREMEVYAAFMEHTDHHVGRMIDALKDMGVLDDTLDLPDHRRQRRIGGRHAPGRLQRDGQLQRRARDRNARVHDVQARGVRRRGLLRPLRGGLGVGDELTVPVDEAGGLALGRHAQRHHRALAQGHQGKGRHPQPVQPRHRRRADGARGGGSPRTDDGQRRHAEPVRRHRACSTPSTTPRRQSGTRRSTSRCSATAASTTRAGAR